MCAEMSADILRQKGSAVDAAITTMLCNGVVHAESSGIGGGGFMVVRLANGSLYSINFRETAPMGSRYDMFHSNPALSSKVINYSSGGVLKPPVYMGILIWFVTWIDLV